MTTSVIVAGARTPIGKLSGSLKDFSGSDLGAVAIKGALEKANVSASLVDYVIMGQVLTAGAGQMPARQSAVAAGIGWDVPALSINKMCLSGIDAIALADQLIRAGEFEVVVAGGQESMTKAPHLLMVTVYLADIRDIDCFNRYWDAWVPAGHAPVRACVQAALAHPGYRVEIQATAAITDRS